MSMIITVISTIVAIIVIHIIMSAFERSSLDGTISRN